MTTADDKNDAAEGRDTGQGYPEEQPEGMGIDARDHAEDDVADDAPDAPAASPRRDGDAGQATGNPRAAGGDEAP